VLERLLPEAVSGLFAEQVQRRTLRQIASFAGDTFSEERLRALDEELGAIPE
jgi:hypothetical protein